MNIKRLQFSIDIQSEKSIIWNALWSDEGYRYWTQVFGDGSHAVSKNWEENTKVHFLGPDKSGIYSLIEKHVPNELMNFSHIGMVKEGIELDLDKETKTWTGTKENYSLTKVNAGYRLTIDIDILEDHVEFMSKTLPKALQKVKDYCLS